MTCRLLSRERGATLKCNTCGARVQTGQVSKGAIRTYARSLGWGRGSVAGDKRKGIQSTKAHDLCKPCLDVDRAVAGRIRSNAIAAKAERVAAKDAKRRALLDGKAVP